MGLGRDAALRGAPWGVASVLGIFEPLNELDDLDSRLHEIHVHGWFRGVRWLDL